MERGGDGTHGTQLRGTGRETQRQRETDREREAEGVRLKRRGEERLRDMVMFASPYFLVHCLVKVNVLHQCLWCLSRCLSLYICPSQLPPSLKLNYKNNENKS